MNNTVGTARKPVDRRHERPAMYDHDSPCLASVSEQRKPSLHRNVTDEDTDIARGVHKLHRQLAVKTSSTKKRKLSPPTGTDKQSAPGPGPDIPITSVEGRDSSPAPADTDSDLPRFDTEAQELHRADSLYSLRAQSRAQSHPPYTAILLAPEAESDASSPTAGYACLSIDSDRGVDLQSARKSGFMDTNQHQDDDAQSPKRSPSQRVALRGGAGNSERASSPLKRRATDLEPEDSPQENDNDDVDMIPVGGPSPTSTRHLNPPIVHAARSVSVDMLGDEPLNTPLKQAAKPAMETSGVSVSVAEKALTSPPQSPTAPTSAWSMTNDAAAGPGTTIESPPSIDYQIATITTICQAEAANQIKENDKVFLVSKKWLQRVLDRGSEALKNSKESPEGEIGPIDNSDIVERIITDHAGFKFAQLKHGVGMESFIPFSVEAWSLVKSWYGLKAGQQQIVRSGHNTNPDKTGKPNMAYEFHPPIFHIHRLWSRSTNLVSKQLRDQNPQAPVFWCPRSTSYMDILAQIKSSADIPLGSKVQVWRVPRTLPAAEPALPTSGTATPPESRPGTPGPDTTNDLGQEQDDSWKGLLLEVDTFLRLEKGTERELVAIEDQTANTNYNGRSDIAMAGLGDSQALVLDELVQDKFAQEKLYVSTSSAIKTSKVKVSKSGFSTSQPNSGRNSPAPQSTMMTRGRTQRQGKPAGTVGLSNLGNTCYMNSALQCVRSVKELTEYFLRPDSKIEFNYENPLGHHGQVADAYKLLLREMYKDPPPSSVTPRHFKAVVSKQATTFSGYGQQDSQEFVGFLLDGLQEDLNRIYDKPYIEKPDSTDEMVNDPEAIKAMAAQIWGNMKRRDDSVISDLFTGMYKSTLVCPECDKVSITFDPFTNLTLQLPIKAIWDVKVIFYPLYDRPTVIDCMIDKTAPMSSLKEFVSVKVGVPAERLLVVEQFKNKFFKHYNEYESASDQVQHNDLCTIHELEAKPTNIEKKKPERKQKSHSEDGNNSGTEAQSWDNPLAERMIVPVIHRHHIESNRYGNKPDVLEGPPAHYIILTPEEARSEEIITKKILAKVVTYTTSTSWDDEPTPGSDETSSNISDRIDPELVITTGSDADSGDGKVAAHSVDGEEEMVDVSMNDHAPAADEASSASAPKPLKVFNTRRPKFLAPGAFCPADLQNLFEVSWFKFGDNEPFGCGWAELSDDKTIISSIKSRVSLSAPEAKNGDQSFSSSDSSSSNDTDLDAVPTSVHKVTRINDDSEDESVVLPIRSKGRGGARSAGARGKKLTTYSRKNEEFTPTKKFQMQKKRRQHAAKQPIDKPVPDDGPLVRLGEGLVIDWNEGAFDSLFRTKGPGSSRAVYTWGNKLEELKDPGLAAQRQAAKDRRKGGLALDDCLDEFGRKEILSDADTWYCPRCKEHQRASKTLELWKTPDILVMHLKRFSSSGYKRDKLDVLVKFPLENLDLSSRVVETEEGKEEIYDLIAVDDHWGGMGGGHYTAFAKNFVDGEWYEYNDSSVSKQTDLTRMISASAYLLFYRRRSDGPLGGEKLREICQSLTSEDEDSGEDRRLVTNSSRRGSGALTGVGVAHHRRNGSMDGEETTTANLLEGEDTSYEDSHDFDRPHDSVEDEVNDGKSYVQSKWDFDNLKNLNGFNVNQEGGGMGSREGSDDGFMADDDEAGDARSDVPDASSSAGNSNAARDFENSMAAGDLPGESFDDADHLMVPDCAPDTGIDPILMQQAVLNGFGPEYRVVADEEEEADEPAMDIHVEEGEGLK